MSKLNILAGAPYEAYFTVVSSDGLTSEVLNIADTATFKVDSVGVDSVCVLAPIAMTLSDADNGQFRLNLTAIQTALLVPEIGFGEDGYKSMNNYRGLVEFTLVSGNRQSDVLISVTGSATCPVI